MTPRTDALAPPSLARLAGLLYLLVILGGLFCVVVVRGSLVVGGDPDATAVRLAASEGLWRTGIAVDLAICGITVVLEWILYLLLRAVDRDLALLMLVLDSIAIGLAAAFDLNLLAALFPLGKAGYLGAFTPEQLHTLSFLAIRGYTLGFGIALLFFGLVFPVRGYLIARSGFLPRTLGVLLTIAGVGYVVNGFVLILDPALAGRVFPFVAVPILVGEASLALWLLIRGVDAGRWRARAGLDGVAPEVRPA